VLLSEQFNWAGKMRSGVQGWGVRERRSGIREQRAEVEKMRRLEVEKGQRTESS